MGRGDKGKILNNAFYQRSKCIGMKFRGEMADGGERDGVKRKERGE